MRIRSFARVASLLPLAVAAPALAEPIEHEGGISDVFAFISFDDPSRVTLLLCVDPWQEPGEGPGPRPFDGDVRYDINVDNDNDAIADVIFRFRFNTQQRLPNLPQALLGVEGGAVAPANSPPPVPPGTPIVPGRIVSFSSPGLGQRQSYIAAMIKDDVVTPITNGGGSFFAVPPNAGPRTIDYAAVFDAGIYTASLGFSQVKLFAGTVDDPGFADSGGLFDTFNTSKAPPVLSAAEDAANVNLASDRHAGFAVNAIAVEVPIALLTRTGAIEPASSPAATIGVWGSTARPRLLTRRAPLPSQSSGSLSQVDRRGHPLVKELVIGAGLRERFSLDQPGNDAQFASFWLDPSLARILNALTGGAIVIGTPPRTDLLPLLTYAPPIAAPGTSPGPVADLLRLNTGVAATPTTSPSLSRLGLLGGDPAGYPNGRRPFDDVTDVVLRLIAGGVLAPPAGSNPAINGRLGDGVNVNDAPFRTGFPYLAHAPSGRSRRHVDPGEPACTPLFGGGAPCLP